MNVGLDIGYSSVKAVSGDRRVTFPSVVGTPDRARFSLDGSANGPGTIALTAPAPALVGEGAVSQSRFLARREDRNWIDSPEYLTLFLAALTEMTGASARINLVTGLPVAFYDDRDRLRDTLAGIHRVTREGRSAQTLTVEKVRVIPQPFGALLSMALGANGQIADKALASGTAGVIDVGGKTTNLLSVSRLSEIGRETASVNVGAWDVIRAVRDHLAADCPGLDLRDHELAAAVQARSVHYYGQWVDLGPVVDAALKPLADQVLAQATQLWNGGARLDAVLVSGGGALLLGPRITAGFRHARIVSDPVFANAQGYWRLSQR